jgi:hypothetical protein
MALLYFRIVSGELSGSADLGVVFADQAAASSEMMTTCGDLLAQIARKMKLDAEWRRELLDEFKRPVFRVRLVTETLVQP